MSCKERCLASAFVEIRHIVPDEERLVLLKPVMLFSFTYGVLRGQKFNYFKKALLSLL